MSIELAVDIIRQLVMQCILLVLPVMLTALVVGIGVSFLQSITSLQESTLVFIPKLLAVGAVFVFSSHWMIRNLIEFTVMFMQKIPDMVK